jgi:hypothetical protein
LGGRFGLLALAVALVAVLAVVAISRLGGGEEGAAGQPTVPPTPGPTSTAPSAGEAVFPAFYPVTTLADAKRLQDSVDNGHQPLIVDAREVARQFARDYIGWQKVDLGTEKKSGSAAEGWRATVELRPYIGEANPPATLGVRHVVEMIGLAGAEQPTWFVTGITSDNIELETDDPPVRARSPLTIKGRGVGFEGTVNTEIKDDAGTVLHPRPGRQEGFVQAGATDPEPFVGTLEFARPKTPGGVLILKGGTGLDGPPPACTIVRLAFVT